MDRNRAFGKQNLDSDHVDAVIKAQNLNGLADKFNDIKESKYASQMREPLGKAYERKYQMPGETQTDGFKYGVPSGQCVSAKELLYPAGGSLEERPETAAMYVKTHGNIPAGSQKDREYDWRGINPATHAFGYGEKRVPNGAKHSIHNERIDENFPKTVIVKKTVEDVRATITDQLGISKNLGQGLKQDPEKVFGIKNQVEGQWNAAKCIHGEPSERELQPDSDLGMCTKPGMRNTLRESEDIGRTFGCPTIRTDIPTKKLKSVADH